MALQDELASTIEDSSAGESPAESDDSAGPDDGLRSPFSMNYDVNSFNIDSDDMNNALTAVVAIANLL